MTAPNTRKQLPLEVILILVSVGLTCLLYRISGFKMLVLNLYFLPPFGANIIRTVHGYVALVYGDAGESHSPAEALCEMRCDFDGSYHPAVLDALDRVIFASSPSRTLVAEQVAIEV